MMRACPKCGDFYADGSSPFCLADGAPLTGVAPDSDAWGEGVRVVEEKARALRRHERKLKWRRVLFSVTTTLVVTTVLCVVALNTLIYFRPLAEEGVPTGPLALATATPTPAGPDDPIIPSTGPSTAPSTAPTIEPTPRSTASPGPSALPTATTSPTASPTTSPTRDVKPSPSPTVTITPTTSPTIPPKTSPTASPTTSPTASPVTSPTAIVSTTTPRTPTPDVRQTPTPDLRRTPTPTPTPTPRPVCSDADRRREGESLIRNFGAAWRRRIEADRRKVIARYAADPRGAQNGEASLVEVEFSPTFLEQCRLSVVTARYVWQVRTGATPTAPAKVVSVPGAKQFTCFRLGGGWLCP